MPELPEVEFARQQLSRFLRGKKLAAVTAKAGTPLRRTTPKTIARLGGHTLTEIERLGKHLSLFFDGDLGLHLHLGMTGKIVRRPHGGPEPRFAKVCFHTRTAEVYFCDARRFGQVELMAAFKLRAVRELSALGPDAQNALPPPSELRERLRKKRAIKVVLLDQTVLAGLGNLHAVEALWRAKLSPLARADGLTNAQVRALHRAIRETLKFGLQQMRNEEGDPHYVEEGGANPFFVYDRKGLPCRRKDGGTIERVVQAQRSTFFCPVCQKV